MSTAVAIAPLNIEMRARSEKLCSSPVPDIPWPLHDKDMITIKCGSSTMIKYSNTNTTTVCMGCTPWFKRETWLFCK